MEEDSNWKHDKHDDDAGLGVGFLISLATVPYQWNEHGMNPRADDDQNPAGC